MSTFHYEDDDDDAIFDSNGLLRDGETYRVPLYMRDSAGNVLVDGLGNPLPAAGRQSGYVFTDTRSADGADRYAQHRDYQKAELSSRWRGGLQAGDHLTLAGRNMEALGYNPENGKVILADTSQLDAEALKEEAYNTYKQDLSDAWKTRATDDQVGGACTTSEGTHGYWRRGKDGNLVCQPHSQAVSGQNEWDIAGPLSDSEIAEIKHDAWLELVEALQNAWRR